MHREHMAKGKRIKQALYSAESKIMGYVTRVNKANLPVGTKLTLKKYDKKLRKHVNFTAKDIKK